VWLDHILLPSGKVICMGAVAMRLFVTGASAMRKCPVAPKSDIPRVGSVSTVFVFCAWRAMLGGSVGELGSEESQLLVAIVLSSDSVV
jgi:hypothetical protein